MTDEALPERALSAGALNLGGASAALGLAVIIALFWVFFSSQAPGFLSSFNLFTVGASLAVDIVIGFSQMVVLATGGMNLAVGAIGVCAVMTGGYLMQTLGFPVPLAVLGALLARHGAWLAERLRYRQERRQRLHHHARKRQPLLRRHADPDQGGAAQRLAAGGRRLRQAAHQRLSRRCRSRRFLSSPSLSVLGSSFSIATRVLGRRILAAGANPRAAAMSGVPVGRVIIISHALSGLLAGRRRR